MKEENEENYVYGLYKKNFEYTTNKLDDGLFYIGVTTGKNSIKNRAKGHKSKKDINKLKINIINKYDFDIKVLYTLSSREEAEEREAFLIRWFGKIIEGGILANILDSAGDFPAGYIEKKKKKLRDCLLTVPYEKILEYIEEWAENPSETHIEFCKRKDISSSNFCSWIALYKPEYKRLAKKQKELVVKEAMETCLSSYEIISFIQNKLNVEKCKAVSYYAVYKKKYKNHKDFTTATMTEYKRKISIITKDLINDALNRFNSKDKIVEYFMELANLTKGQSIRFYNSFINDPDINKDHIIKSNKTEEFKLKQVYDYINSGLSQSKFCEQNNIPKNTFSRWVNKYQNKGFKNENNLPITHTPYDWVWKTSPKSATTK
jgi:hypothetical protein